MKPVKFKGHNVIFAKDQPQYLPLPAKRSEDGTVVTHWKGSIFERVKFLFTGTVKLTMLTFNLPLQPARIEI